MFVVLFIIYGTYTFFPSQIQNHVSFLHEEFMKLPAFPRKALEAEFSLYNGKGGEASHTLVPLLKLYSYRKKKYTHCLLPVKFHWFVFSHYRKYMGWTPCINYLGSR